MTDFANVPKVNQLAGERRQVEQALANFASKGQITEFTVSGGEGSRGGPVTILVSDINPPDSVTTFFKSELQKRLTAIDKELSSLGMTGMAQAHAAWKARMQRGPEVQPPKTPQQQRPGGRW